MILENYVKYHGIGSHCTTTMLRTLTNAAGFPFSEAYCLGLGSGIGFTYQKYVGVDYYFFTGRNECIEDNLVNVLGGKILKGTDDDSLAAWKSACELIDQGIPVILEVDMMKLSYIREKLNLKKQFHFGLHTVLLIGYEEESAYILDYMWRNPIKVTVRELQEARNSKDAPVRPNNAWKALFVKNNDFVDLPYVTTQAIRINVHKYKEPYAFKMGLEGLLVFKREFERWLERMDAEKRKDYFYMMSVLFEKVGTGGGNFRRMYGQFLDEAGRIIPNKDFTEVSAAYTRCFHAWRKFSRHLEQLSERDDIGNEKCRLQEELENICEYETQALALLAQI